MANRRKTSISATTTERAIHMRTTGPARALSSQTPHVNPGGLWPQEKSMNDSDLHDAEIFAVRHVRTEATLTFEVRTEAGDTLAVHCIGVTGFALDPFEEQNIIFALRTYSSSSLPKHLRDDLLPYYTDAITAGASYLQLDPSAGMGGWVVAEEVRVEKLAAGPPPLEG